MDNKDAEKLLNELRNLPRQRLSGNRKQDILQSIRQKGEKESMRHLWKNRTVFAASLLIFPLIMFVMWQMFAGDDTDLSVTALGHPIDLTPSDDFEGDSPGNADQIVPVGLAGYYSVNLDEEQETAGKVEELLSEEYHVQDFETGPFIHQSHYSFVPFQYVDDNNYLYIGAASFLNRDEHEDAIHQLFTIQITEDNLRTQDEQFPERTAMLNWEQENYFLGVGWTTDSDVTETAVDHALEFDTVTDGQIFMAAASFTNEEKANLLNEHEDEFEYFKDRLEADLCRSDTECYPIYFLRHPELPFPD